MEANRGTRITSRLILGLAVITIGVLFTLDNLGVMDAREIIRYWPAVFIAIGVAKFATSTTAAGRVSAGIWVIAGVLLLMDALQLLSFDPWDLWPLFLVALGITIVMRATRTGRGSAAQANSDDALSALAIMAGVERKYASQTFRGGEATAIMGSCEIDLRQASIQNDEVVVDTFAFWGSVEIRVPSDWTVRNEVIAIMGSVEDTRKEISADPNKRLVLKGLAVMGGVEIKN